MELRWNHENGRIELISRKGMDDSTVAILKRYGDGRLDPQGECVQDLSYMLLNAPWQITRDVLRKLDVEMNILDPAIREAILQSQQSE